MLHLEAANKALTLLGVAPIASLDSDVQAARTMKNLFPSVERAVLSDFPWSFALRLSKLESRSGAVLPSGWQYAFRYPYKAIVLYQVYLNNMEKIHYIVENNVVFTNDPDPFAEYTVKIDFKRWPNQVAEAFTARLASDAAVTLTGSPQLASAMLDKYGILFSFAKSASLNEENIPHKKSTHYLDVRY